jgi:hypothetical protein
MVARKLGTDQCRVRIDPSTLQFETTAEVEPASGVVSQERALDALELGLEIRQPRFHIVVVGSPGSGRTFSVRSTAERLAKGRPTPDDLLLLPNPDRPSEPTALFLPAGTGRGLLDTMSGLYGKIVDALHAATEGERFKHAETRVQRKARREEARLEQELAEIASSHGFSIERSGGRHRAAQRRGRGARVRRGRRGRQDGGGGVRSEARRRPRRGRCGAARGDQAVPFGRRALALRPGHREVRRERRPLRLLREARDRGHQPPGPDDRRAAGRRRADAPQGLRGPDAPHRARAGQRGAR